MSTTKIRVFISLILQSGSLSRNAVAEMSVNLLLEVHQHGKSVKNTIMLKVLKLGDFPA